MGDEEVTCRYVRPVDGWVWRMKAIAYLQKVEDQFCEQAEYLFRLGKYHAILGNVEEAKNLVRQVFKLNGSFKADFLDDPAFDSVWESF